MEEGKGKRDPRRKEKERIGQRKRDLGDQSRGKGSLDQRDLWEGGDFSRIKIIKASWTRVLFDDDCGFHLGIGSVSDDDDDDGFWKKREKRGN